MKIINYEEKEMIPLTKEETLYKSSIKERSIKNKKNAIYAKKSFV